MSPGSVETSQPASSAVLLEAEWEKASGLSFDEAEALLDSLEGAGITERELKLESLGFAVRWRPVGRPLL